LDFDGNVQYIDVALMPIVPQILVLHLVNLIFAVNKLANNLMIDNKNGYLICIVM